MKYPFLVTKEYVAIVAACALATFHFRRAMKKRTQA